MLFFCKNISLKVMLVSNSRTAKMLPIVKGGRSRRGLSHRRCWCPEMKVTRNWKNGFQVIISGQKLKLRQRRRIYSEKGHWSILNLENSPLVATSCWPQQSQSTFWQPAPCCCRCKQCRGCCNPGCRGGFCWKLFDESRRCLCTWPGRHCAQEETGW